MPERKRLLILGSTGVAVAAAMVVTLLTTPLYRATATLELNPPTVEIMEGNKGIQSFTTGDRQFLATQYGLLRSHALAERVAARFQAPMSTVLSTREN